MSLELERIERVASQKMVKDFKDIAYILDRLLGRTVKTLVPPSEKGVTYMTVLANDIARGYDIEPNEIKECSVGDLLMMIQREDNNDYFEAPAENERILYGKLSTQAGHCFYLGGNMNTFKNKDVWIKQFLSIRFLSLTAYLRASLKNEFNLGNMAMEDYKSSIHLLDYAKNEIKSYYSKMKSINNDQFGSVTLGDIIECAYKEGVKSWNCSVNPLTNYTEGVIRAFCCMDNIFMDCITNALVLPHAEQYSRGVELSRPALECEDDVPTLSTEEKLDLMFK